MVSTQVSNRRVYCVSCKRKRLLKFMYRIILPFCSVVIEVCVDCFEKYSDKIQIDRSAEVASKGAKR